MHLIAAASVFVLSALPTVSASTKYGCWSESGAKFHESCVVALTALVTSRTHVDHVDYVDIPGHKITYQYDSCHAELFGKGHGYSVNARNLLYSFGQLASRCQNGWFYYDDGWVGGAVGGRAGWKRDAEEDSMSYLLTNTIFAWDEADSPEKSPLTEESVAGNDLNSTSDAAESIGKRQVSSRVTPRASPVGDWLYKHAIGNLMFHLYRGTGYDDPRQHPASYQISLAFPAVIGAVMNDAKSNFGTGVIRNGLAQPSGSGVNALALAAQLNPGVFENWDKLATFMNGEFLSSIMGLFMAHALQDMVNKNWAGAIYHIYNSYNEVIVTFIFNGVTGVVSALPRR